MNLTKSPYRVRFYSDRFIKPEDRVFHLMAKVWVYQGPAPWYLLTLPVKAAKVIKQRFGHSERGWGSLRVQVTAGSAVWKTSIFSDKKSASYLLPLKAEARKKAGIKRGDMLSFTLTLL